MVVRNVVFRKKKTKKGRVGRKKGKKPTVRKANRLGLFTEVTVDDSRPKHAFPTQSCAADTH